MQTIAQRGALIIILIVLISAYSISEMKAQNVAVTDNELYSANPSAMLDVYSTTKGMLVPRLTTLARDTMSFPATGLIVFDTDFNSFFYYNSENWVKIPQVNSAVEIGSGSALFAVVNATGDTIFAVYNDGVKVVVPYGTKGSVGGFAVSGRTPTKAGEEQYLLVTPDSTRVFINETDVKGSVGGFAVSGRTPTKSSLNNYFITNYDSTRIYVDTSETKGSLGGFAVSGRTPTKAGYSSKFLDLTKNNYFIGHESGKSIGTGLYNSFIGYQSGFNTNYGSNNLFIGYKSGYSNTGGGNNVYIGTESGYSSQNTYQNTYIGYRSGYELTGALNTLVGSSAGEFANGGGNTFVGTSAGRIAKGGNNTFFGVDAGYNFPVENTGTRNTFIGQSAGRATTSGSYNTMLGFNSGDLNYEGSRNTFLGYQTGNKIQNGSGNIFIGYKAASNINNIYDRLVIENSEADSTAALIYGSFDQDYLRFNADIGIGIAPSTSYKLYVYKPAATATSITRAGYFRSYGGSSSGSAYGLTSNSYAYGSSTSYAFYADATGGTTTGNEYAFYGYGDCYFSGDVGIGTSTPNYKLDVAGTVNLSKGLTGAALRTNGTETIWFDGTYFSWGYGATYNYFARAITIADATNRSATFKLYVAGNAYTTGSWGSSDLRYKKNVTPLNNILNDLMQISAVRYEWKQNEFKNMNFDDKTHIGVIAQDVEKVFPELVITDDNGYKAVAYDKLAVLLLEGTKEQQTQIEELKNENEKLQSQLIELAKRIENLEK